MKHIITRILLGALLAGSTGAFAQTPENVTAEELINMSLEELMNITVTTASKNQESVKDAPAIISVITAKEIEGYGAMSLSEILDRATAIYANGTYYPKGNITIRGDHTGLFDTHVLFLINGRPLRESFHNGANYALNTMVPVDNIERIEIIRGPGSVLYGTSAYSGVINIITKMADKPSAKGFVRYGSFDTKQAGFSGTTVVKGIEIGGALNYFDSNGWNFTARDEKSQIRNRANTADSLKAPYTFPMDEQGIGAMLQVGYKGLKISSNYTQSNQRIMGRTPVWSNPVEYSFYNTRGFIDGGYTHSFSKLLSSSINVTYNHLLSKHYIPLDSYKEDIIVRNSDDVLVEMTHYIKPTENINIVLGALANTQTGWATQPELTANFENFDLQSGVNPNPHYQVPAYRETWGSAYVQADYSPFSFVKIITGGQLNKATGHKASFVPRLGSIFTLTKSLSAKVLYGQAFRSPAFFEAYALSLPGIVGNKHLNPELVRTFETQLSYSARKFEIALTYFNSAQSSLISRSNVKDSLYMTEYNGMLTSIPQYINKGSLTSQGLELESKANLTDHLSTVGSVAYQTNTNDKGTKDVYGMPMLMAKLGMNYAHPKGFGIGMFNSYFGKGGDITTYTNGKATTKQVNPEVKPYQYLTLNAHVNVFKLLKISSSLQGIFNIYATNLLDEQIYYPELVRRNINSLPGRAGRSIYGSFQVKF
jgi:outer membrane receptor for ferrienterochelin and colicin